MTKKQTIDQSSNFKGRGALSNPPNKFFKVNPVFDLDVYQNDYENLTVKDKTKVIEIEAKTMINKVDSPDLGFEYSVNPYQGCEHGCIYCYARPTHNYWGYSSGADFESNIMIKKNAKQVLRKEINAKQYKLDTIMLSGNTDCYQPVEKEYEITRSILELMAEYEHPVSIITKNSLILRDLDILKELAQKKLVSVAISLTSLRETTRRILEPRASSVQTRLKTIYSLVTAGIPVHVMCAPIIPGINDDEIFSMVQKAADLGARSISYQIVRLNGDIGTIFSDWLDEYFADRKEKILNYIKSCHKGKLSNSTFGQRFKGEGNIADMIKQQFNLAKSKYLHEQKINLNKELFKPDHKRNLLFAI